MPAHRISHAVTRLLKAAFQRQSSHKTTGASYTLLATESLALSSTTLPSAFFKQVKSLLDKQHKEDPAGRFSPASTRSTLFSLSSPVSPVQTASTKSRKRQHKEGSSSSSDSSTSSSLSDCYARLAAMLVIESDAVVTSSSSSSMRSVAVPVAVETLLQLWEFLLQVLQANEASECSSINKQSMLTLLQAIVQRPEFDVMLNSLAIGQCNTHRASSSSSDTRKRRVSSVRLERVESFRVVPATSTTTATIKKSSRRSILKKTKRSGGSSASSTSLCLLARQYLVLHQSTLQFTEDALMSSKKSSSAAGSATRQVHDLLAALVAASFIRIPFLREKILEKLQRVVGASSTKKRSGLEELQNPSNSHQQSPLALFNWQHGILFKCCTAMTPYNRDEFWYPSVHFVETVLEDSDARMLLCGNLIQHFTTASAWGRVEWKRIPGFAVLVDVVLLSTETLVQSQMRLVEMRAPVEDDHMERASTKRESISSSILRDSFTAEPKDRKSSPGAFFFRQLLKLLRENSFLIHATLMVIFKSTNYMLPQHVEICLQYLERFIAVFPRYFRDESLAYSGANEATSTVDIPIMHHVFTCLLESEHFEILKVTELFLLKHFAAFSHSLRTALAEIFATQFRHLFLHWHRDVRYCFFHVLLYLTYSGNRIVLCARSDESILGAEASQLFEIPGLVRTSAMAAWDVFDAPLHAMLTRYNRVSKQLKSGGNGKASIVPPKTTPSTWVDEVPFAELARSIPEYRRQVHTYFQCAKQLSLHEPVPVPVFHVKGAAPHS